MRSSRRFASPTSCAISSPKARCRRRSFRPSPRSRSTRARRRRGAWPTGSSRCSTVVLAVVTLGIFLFAPWILRVYAAGFSPEKLELTVTMTRILAPFLLAVAVAAVAMGILNTYGTFFVPALAPALLNVAAITSVIVLTPAFTRFGWPAGLSLAVGAMVGGVLQFVVQIPPMRKLGFRFRLDWAPRDPGLVRIAWLMLPATIGQAATQINFLVDTWLASRYGDGPITWLSLAFRLIQLPIGLFGVAHRHGQPRARVARRRGPRPRRAARELRVGVARGGASGAPRDRRARRAARADRRGDLRARALRPRLDAGDRRRAAVLRARPLRLRGHEDPGADVLRAGRHAPSPRGLDARRSPPSSRRTSLSSSRFPGSA